MLDKNGKEAVAGDMVQTWWGELLYLDVDTNGNLYGYPLTIKGFDDPRFNMQYTFDFDKNDFVVMPQGE